MINGITDDVGERHGAYAGDATTEDEEMLRILPQALKQIEAASDALEQVALREQAFCGRLQACNDDMLTAMARLRNTLDCATTSA